MPLISVLLPVYNAANDLPRAVNSLLHQTLQDFEVIAIDDGSTDGSGDLLDRYAHADPRIRVFHQENAGALGKVLNRAAELARGKFLARQDADDASEPSRLENQVAYLEGHQNTGLCGTWAWFIDTNLGPLFSLELPDNHTLLSHYLNKGLNPFVHGSLMLRAEVFQKTLAARKSGPEAKEIADRYFFETLVRIHRAGEGAPYTGLQAGPAEPIIAAADRALDTGSIDKVIKHISSAVSEGIKKRFNETLERKKHADDNVTAGRKFVEAYVDFTHYVERLHGDALGQGHTTAGDSAPKGGHAH